MQKATIFTIFFSLIVVVLLAELLINDHLRNGWTAVVPPGASSEASILGAGRTGAGAAPAGATSAPVIPPPIVTQLASPTPTVPAPVSAPANSPGEVAQFVAQTSYRLESVTEDQLHGFGFDQMHLERVSAEGLLFQIIDVTDIVNLSKIRSNLTDGKNVYGVVTEFLLADEGKAATFYETLKQKGSAFQPDIKLNETNAFGAHSFFMNDSKRLGTAFLTVLSGNRVFTFSYPKASHDFFKKLIQLLAH